MAVVELRSKYHRVTSVFDVACVEDKESRISYVSLLNFYCSPTASGTTTDCCGEGERVISESREGNCNRW